MATTNATDVDAVLEQAWQNLYAKLDAVAPLKQQFQGEAQATAIIKTLGQELAIAANALYQTAEALKLQPNMTSQVRLRLAGLAVNHSRRAREAAQSVLG